MWSVGPSADHSLAGKLGEKARAIIDLAQTGALKFSHSSGAKLIP
jgi:hypothetical protein